MGFDDGECYICYACGGGNESVDTTYTICFGCLDKLIFNVTGRWWVAFVNRILEKMLSSDKCDFCGQEKCLVVELSICDGHSVKDSD
jgi:hypothetical protein